MRNSRVGKLTGWGAQGPRSASAQARKHRGAQGLGCAGVEGHKGWERTGLSAGVSSCLLIISGGSIRSQASPAPPSDSTRNVVPERGLESFWRGFKAKLRSMLYYWGSSSRIRIFSKLLVLSRYDELEAHIPRERSCARALWKQPSAAGGLEPSVWPGTAYLSHFDIF